MSGTGRAARCLAAAVVIALWLAGCSSARGQVRAKVVQFAGAVAHHDYRALCGDVLAPALLERISSLGAGCEEALSVALAGVRQPELAIGAILVRGSHATVDVIATAQGQQAALEAIELIDTSSGRRVASLGTPMASLSVPLGAGLVGGLLGGDLGRQALWDRRAGSRVAQRSVGVGRGPSSR
jgi:hypothetical protein